jgi:exosortase C (VPDSG-CTERM-specific)
MGPTSSSPARRELHTGLGPILCDTSRSLSVPEGKSGAVEVTLRSSGNDVKEVTPQHDLRQQLGPLQHAPSHRWSFLTTVTSNRLSGTLMTWRCLPRGDKLRIGGCAGYFLLVLLLFAQPLTRLMLYAARSDFYSYILLVPFISGYVFYMNRSRSSAAYRTSIAGAISVAAIAMASRFAGIHWESDLSVNDGFSLMVVAFVSFVAVGGFLFFGSKWIATMAFPVTFLLFSVPLPDAAAKWLEEALAVASAQAAAWFFNVSGTPVLHEGTLLRLPGIVLRVAQECSGIHSTWVLFMTTLLASQLFLRTRWRRIVLVAFVIPLGIMRNGFRILVIGLLCVHVGPQMINSRFHHRGGPLFFALSLIPLLLLVLWLQRQEMRLNAR